MGNYLQTNVVWYVYRRTLNTDQWISEPVQVWEGIVEDDALGQFKHEAWAFSLGKYDYKEDTKAIYLYCGSERVAKVLLDQETGQVNVWSTKIREWVQRDEKLAKLRYPIQEANFFKLYHKNYAWADPQTISFVKKDK